MAAGWTGVGPAGEPQRAREERRAREAPKAARTTEDWASPGLPAFPECVASEKIRSPLAPKALFPESTVGLVNAPVLLPISASCF